MTFSSSLFSTLNRKSSIEYLEDFYSQLARLLEQKWTDSGICTTTVSAVIETSLNYFSKHRTEFPEPLRPLLDTLDTTRQYHLEIIMWSILNVEITQLVSPEKRHRCGVCLDTLVGYSDLLMIHPRLSERKVI